AAVRCAASASAREGDVVEPEIDAETGIGGGGRKLQLETEPLRQVERHLGAPTRLLQVRRIEIDGDLFPIRADARGNVFGIVVITLGGASSAAAAVAPLIGGRRR